MNTLTGLMLTVFMETPAKAPHFPLAFTLVYIVGFLAAVGIGSIAWYNSKRPPGWEDKDRPDIVPEVNTKEE
jgi:hypothetical protein